MPMHPVHCLTAVAALVASHALPAQRQLREVLGPGPGTAFGAALARSPDANGDGKPEVVVGTPGYDITGAADVGAAFLIAPNTGALLGSVVASGAGARFGTRVAGPGDLDGDGAVDLVLTAPLASAQAGTARAYRTNGQLLWATSGPNNSRFGSGITPVGDVNLDGRPEVMVGAPRNSGPYAFGFCTAVAGTTGQQLSLIPGGNSTDFGAAIAALGDIDGDGSTDVVCGEPLFQQGGLAAGRIQLIRANSTFTSAAIWSVTPFQPGDAGGYSIAAAGDVDGDGKSDVLVPVATGRVYVLSGATGATLGFAANLNVDETSAVDGIGDQNDDGVPDFAVGTPDFNNQAGRVWVYDGASRTLLFTVDGAAGSRFGSALVGLGDIDGDARGDFAVGAPTHTVAGQALGRISLHGITIPQQLVAYGTGCGGTAGVLDMIGIGVALPGQTFGVRLYNLPPQSIGLWLWGTSAATSPFGPLPLDLGVVGATGCSLLTSMDVSFVFTNGAAQYLNSLLNAPNTQTLVGATLYAQGALLDATHAGGLATSNGVRLRIGNQ